MARLTGRLRLRSSRKENPLIPYLYLAPALAVYLVFFAYPFVQLIFLSFQRWDGIHPKRFVGLENYQRLLFEDPKFWPAVSHNVYWLLAAMIVPVFIGLFLAILLYRSPLRGKVFFRTIYFLPQILSTVVVALIWNWIYNPNYGALNRVLRGLGLDFLEQGWLGEPSLAFPALFIAWSWIYYGFAMVIFIAALQAIDETYFDAAKVDGANWWQQFRHILIPFIQGPLTIILLITAIAAFQVFDIVYVLTRGGPAGHTMIMSILMYQNAFEFNKVGYGSAIAVMLGLVVLFLSIVFLRMRGVFSEDTSI
jgi:multiple sugar transport system permease protein/raffinose/stachyose/melibiose transport system permease protein